MASERAVAQEPGAAPPHGAREAAATDGGFGSGQVGSDQASRVRPSREGRGRKSPVA